MRRIPISSLVLVKSSKASSIFFVSVLLSTTRKFLWGVGPVVTCCGRSHQYTQLAKAGGKKGFRGHVRVEEGSEVRTPMPARRSPVTESCELLATKPDIVSKPAPRYPGGLKITVCSVKAYLVTDNGDELAVFEVYQRGRHCLEGGVCWMSSSGEVNRGS